MILLLAIAGLVVFFALVRFRTWRDLRQAALDAQMARDSDELDLDRRLGPKQKIEIESTSGEPVGVAYRQSGHGPDVICLHGIGASMMIYRRVVPWLSNDHTVTCIDFPGFGSSDKPKFLSYALDEQARHLEKIVSALKLDRPMVLASSMGGAIALKAAMDEDSLFTGILAMAPAVDPKRVPMVLLPLAKYGEKFHRINSLTTVGAAVGQVIARRELITPGLISLYQEPFRDNGASSSAFMKAFHLLADPRMPALFRDLTTPLLIVRGLRDRLVKQAGCEDLRRLVPHSTLVTHPTAGHHIMEDEPEFIARELRRFEVAIQANSDEATSKNSSSEALS